VLGIGVVVTMFMAKLLMRQNNQKAANISDQII